VNKGKAGTAGIHPTRRGVFEKLLPYNPPTRAEISLQSLIFENFFKFFSAGGKKSSHARQVRKILCIF
jgi:hypothetical protein